MDYLRVLLFGILNQEKKDSNNYIIAHYILSNFASLDKLNNTTLAKACHVSKSAITRFCHDLGLEDLLDLQMFYRASHKDNYDYKYNIKSQDYSTYLGNYFQNFKVDESLLEQLIEDIHDKKVYVFANMSSANAARTLQYDLSSFNIIVEVIDYIPTQKEIIQNATRDEVIIIFSTRHNFFRIVDPRNKLTINAKVYMISSCKYEETRSDIDVFYALSNEYSYATSLIGLIAFSNLLVLKYQEKYIHNQ